MPSPIFKTDMLQIKELKESIKKGFFKYYFNYNETTMIYKEQNVKEVDNSVFMLDDHTNCSYLDVMHTAYIDKLLYNQKYNESYKYLKELINSDIEENIKIQLYYTELLLMILNNNNHGDIINFYNSNKIQDNLKNLEYAMSINLYAYHMHISKDIKKQNFYLKLINSKINAEQNKYEKENLNDLLTAINEKQD